MRLLVRILRALAAIGFACLAYVYLLLPDVRELRHISPPTTAFIALRGREARARGETPRRRQQWVGYTRISQNLKRAVLVAEDSAFWEHGGIDLEQIKESVEINIERGRVERGASTITQQLAKNLYLSPSRDPVRKLRELLIARRLEVELSKTRIFELYLNVVEWGDGVYGAEAAAQAYFGKPVAALLPDEAALLAGALINPRALNPAEPSNRLLRRQRLILRRMGAVVPPPPEPSVIVAVESAQPEEAAPAPKEETPTELAPTEASEPAPEEETPAAPLPSSPWPFPGQPPPPEQRPPG